MELNSHEYRRVAVEAICDPGTVARYLSGRRVRSTSATRIERALKALGLEGPKSPEPRRKANRV